MGFPTKSLCTPYNEKMPLNMQSYVWLFSAYTVYVKEQTIMLNTITPSDILLEGHKSELTTYKGIMISKQNASKDMFKIDLLKMLQDK